MHPSHPAYTVVGIVHLFITALFIAALLTCSFSSLAASADARNSLRGETAKKAARFILLNRQGKPLPPTTLATGATWSCVLDQQTGLLWEVKTDQPGLHYRHNTYSWFNPDPTQNGGLVGQPGGAECRKTPCDTHAFIRAVNAAGLCGVRGWRLPRREELRSLVDYRIPYPGPTLNQAVFPHAVAQFYWSADPAAADAMEAWGIGFAHGFDYAYFKSNRVHVRLVSDSR